MRIFVAGATGATGQVFIPMATQAGHDVLFHVRPKTAEKTPLGKDPRARIFDLDDAAALAKALSGREAVLSFVGTMRGRFKAGDTYESSDIGSTRQLVDGAKAASVSRFLLLSSYGAGGMGAYLKMKGECERIVRDSGLSYSLFRPSALASPSGGPESPHGARKPPAAMGALLGAVGRIPGLHGWADDVKPIPIEVVCDAFLAVLADPDKWNGRILEGRDLWAFKRL